MADAPNEDDFIAVIGMAGRFPGAPTIEDYWQNLKDGVEAIQFFSDEELREAGELPSRAAAPNYVPASPVLADIDKFDAAFFGLSPRDASVMDPAHRLFLEVCWNAVEHSGHAALSEEGDVGVWAASGAPLYWLQNLQTNPALMASMGEFLVRHTSNDMNFLATRVSYEMDFRGPSVNVQTACSSALVAVHMACESLKKRECDFALAGGATVLLPEKRGYLYEEGEILSPDGHCRPFDAKSAGTVFGSGVGCVVLRRLKDALDDGDTVYAIIRGSAINNDGALRVGYLAPGVDGQAECVRRAIDAAGLSPDDISYVEAHGTGTKVGDPIEVEALTTAFRTGTERNQFCGLGSVKSNIGHLGEAAGIASFIKLVLALRDKKLPKSLGYETPNPAIDFTKTPFYVVDELRDWSSDGPLRAGVTSLGAGGTNCHIVVEEAPEPEPTEGGRGVALLCLSAKSLAALDRLSGNLANHLETHPDQDLNDVAFTLHDGRRDLPYRRVLAAASKKDAVQLLREGDPQRVVTRICEGIRPSVVFMFPGGGAQYAGMGADLYREEAVYREAVDECLKLVRPGLGVDLAPLMYPEAGHVEDATRQLERPSLALPALFATSYGLARLFASWGVEPDAMIGHSMGEYVAACLSGVLTLEDALELVCVRGRLFETVEKGGMLTVSLSREETEKRMPEGLSIAAANAPTLCVASGPVGMVESFQRQLEADGIDCKRVHIDVAAHSSMLEPILAEFRAFCQKVTFGSPQVPYVSNLSGTWIRPEEAKSPEYWVQHLRQTVRFADGMSELLADSPRVVVEMGPGRTLSSLARMQPGKPVASLSTVRHPKETVSDLEFALRTLGGLWSAGVRFDWLALYDEQLRRRVPLPVYPFEKDSYWVKPGVALRGADQGSLELSKRPDIEDWFYEYSWDRKSLGGVEEGAAGHFLIFCDSHGIGEKLAESVEAHLVYPGPRHVRTGANSIEIDPEDPSHFESLFRDLRDAGTVVTQVVYLWTVGGDLRQRARSKVSGGLQARLPRGLLAATNEQLERRLLMNFWALFWLGKAMDAQLAPLTLTVVSTQLQQVLNEPVLAERALLLGPVRTIPRECPQIRTRSIDLESTGSRLGGNREAMALLRAELLSSAEGDQVVAYRGGQRWVQSLRPRSLPALPPRQANAKRGVTEGPYLITGGLGGIGLEVARHLVESGAQKLVLLTRSALPEESEWKRWVATRSPTDRTSQRIRAVGSLRATGATVVVLNADVTHRLQLAQALARAEAELGPVRGVIHAAGTMDDEPLQLKTKDSASRVLDPKVRGTLALDEVFGSRDLEFFVLFSSVASALGLPGQIDYTAANAFLDAFALERSSRSTGKTLVINWNAWQRVGMAAELAAVEARGYAEPARHPLISGYTARADSTEFVCDLNSLEHWILSEHKIKGGGPVAPGTSILELVRACAEETGEGRVVELAHVQFLAPIRVGAGASKRLYVRCERRASDRQEFKIFGSTDVEAFASGEIRLSSGTEAAPCSREAPGEDFGGVDRTPSDGFLEQDFVEFGPRWANIKRARYRGTEALLELELDPRFAPDLEQYTLHPALLDMATGGAQGLMSGVDLRKAFYVPIGYASIKINAPLSAKILSHIRLVRAEGDVAEFDVTLFDPNGSVLLDISGFSMKRVDRGSAITEAVERVETKREAALLALLREAILPEEGVQVLSRLMSQPVPPQVFVSSVDLNVWQKRLEAEARALASADEGDGEGPKFKRPSLLTPYIAPRNPAEVLIARIWEEMLGVEGVGVQDDFHQLGGHSLLAVRMIERIKRETGAALPLAALFEAATVEALAAHVDIEAEPVDEAEKQKLTSLVAVKPGGTRPPLFMPHGVGGTVHWGYANVARHLSDEQPVFGLQVGDNVISNFKEMARFYLTLVREKQPKGPYYLAGYCYGGNLAYEMAVQLRAAGEEVGLLALVEAWPVNSSFGKITVTPDYLYRFGRNVVPFATEFLRRPRRDQAQAVRGKISAWKRKLGQARAPIHSQSGDQVGGALGTPPPGADMLDMQDLARYSDGQQETWGRNLRALWADVPEPFDGDAVVIRTRRQPLRSPHDPTMGWGDLVRGKVETHEVPGSHFSIVDEPEVRAVSALIEERLSRRG